MANVILTTTKDGLVQYLKSLTNNEDSGNLYARVFNNNVTITEDTVLGDLTESINYIPVELLGTNWTVGYNNRGEAVYTIPVEFTFTGTESIYGVYVTNTAGTGLVSAGNFDAPVSVQAEDQIKLTTIQINLDN